MCVCTSRSTLNGAFLGGGVNGHLLPNVARTCLDPPKRRGWGRGARQREEILFPCAELILDAKNVLGAVIATCPGTPSLHAAPCAHTEPQQATPDRNDSCLRPSQHHWRVSSAHSARVGAEGRLGRHVCRPTPELHTAATVAVAAGDIHAVAASGRRFQASVMLRSDTRSWCCLSSWQCAGDGSCIRLGSSGRRQDQAWPRRAAPSPCPAALRSHPTQGGQLCHITVAVARCLPLIRWRVGVAVPQQPAQHRRALGTSPTTATPSVTVTVTVTVTAPATQTIPRTSAVLSRP